MSILPEYNNIGSAIIAFELSKNPLNISTLSFTIFSFKQVDINVWSAPDKASCSDVLVTSVSSVNDGKDTKKDDGE